MKAGRFIVLFLVLQATGAQPSRLLLFGFALGAQCKRGRLRSSRLALQSGDFAIPPEIDDEHEEYEHFQDIVK